jgi:hypothetical protein
LADLVAVMIIAWWGWSARTLAEHAGTVSPDGMQRLLRARTRMSVGCATGLTALALSLASARKGAHSVR